MSEQIIVKERDEVIVRFSGDSGDGMQLAGNIFSTVSATVGNDICTFPDYPADIRAPQGSLTGVSGFQVHIGSGEALFRRIEALAPTELWNIANELFAPTNLTTLIYR